jgi:hypothetical protein
MVPSCANKRVQAKRSKAAIDNVRFIFPRCFFVVSMEIDDKIL